MDLDIHRRRWRRDGGHDKAHLFLFQPLTLKPSLPSAANL
jgi:hypothetical protein